MPTWPSFKQLAKDYPEETIVLLKRANVLVGQLVRAVGRDYGVAIGIYDGVQRNNAGVAAVVETGTFNTTRINLSSLVSIEPLVWEDSCGQPGRGAYWGVMLQAIVECARAQHESPESYLDWCVNIAAEGAKGVGGVWEVVTDQLIQIRQLSADRRSIETRLERLIKLIEAQYDLEFDRQREFAKEHGFREPEPSSFRRPRAS